MTDDICGLRLGLYQCSECKVFMGMETAFFNASIHGKIICNRCASLKTHTSVTFNDYPRICIKKAGDKYELSWVTFAGIYLEKWELIDLKNSIEEILES